MTYFGSASSVADNGSDTTTLGTITPPASMLAGDLVLIFEQVRRTGYQEYIIVSESGGQTWIELGDFAGTNCACRVLACRFNGTWSANPAFDNIYCDGYPFTVPMHVFRPSSSAVDIDIDVNPVAGTFAAGTTPFTKTITGITTLTAGALVVAAWASVDDNTWDSLTGGWSTLGSAQYRNTGGSDQSMTFAYRVFAAAGATGNVSVNQATNGGDAGTTFIIAFKEWAKIQPGTPPAVDLYCDLENGSNGNAITPTILTACTHLSSAAGSWSEDENTPETTSSISTSGEAAFGAGKSVTVGGTTYEDASGTRGFRYDHTNGDVTGKYLFVFDASKNSVSVGYFFKTDTAYNTFYAFAGGMCMWDVSGHYILSNFNAYWTDHHRFTIDTSYGNGGNIGIPFLLNHQYWVTIKYDYTAGLACVAVFDVENGWARIGFTQQQSVSGMGQVHMLSLGRVGGDFVVLTGKSTYFDDPIADWTDAVFPLVPGTAAAGGLSLQVASEMPAGMRRGMKRGFIRRLR